MTEGRESNGEPIDYVGILARLRWQRAELDQMVAGIEYVAAADSGPADASPVPRGTGSTRRRSTYKAVVELLREARRPMTNDELRQALSERGDRWEINSLYTAARKRKVCEFERVGRGRWALKP